jgi:hypothetical protein
MCEIAHHLAAMLGQLGAILTEPQGVMDGVLHESRMRKKVVALTLADGKVRRGRLTILPRPGIHVPEKNSVRVEHVPIGKSLDMLQMLHGSSEILQKDAMLESFDLAEVFEPFRIPEIASRFEVAENIESHGPRCLI